MRFLLLPNNLQTDAVEYTSSLAVKLKKLGHTPLILQESATDGRFSGVEIWMPDQSDPDMLLIAGGDGTVLRALRQLGRCDLPVWGVNFGHLGYLTECEPDGAEAALERILSGAYTVEQRTVLAGELLRADGGQGASFLAFNEANICRAAMARALRLELSVGGSFVRSLSADGIILSTPTGSTAYNFSAGGPILLPTMDCFAITSVCPHAALSCALVADGSDTVSVRVHIAQQEPGAAPLLVADGCERFELRDGDEVRMFRAAEKLRLVKTCRENFYARLQQKLAQG